jgi:hypothetical protein
MAANTTQYTAAVATPTQSTVALYLLLRSQEQVNLLRPLLLHIALHLLLLG